MTRTLQHPYALKIGDCCVIVGAFYALTLWPQEIDAEGRVLMVPAFPEGTEAQKQTAAELGYRDVGDDSAVAQMTREHDPLHSLTAVRLDGLHWSPTLYAVAKGRVHAGAPEEEQRVLRFQRCMNAPESSCSVEWRALRAEALSLLR